VGVRVRVLITGGAGFIGHNLVLYLIKRGYDVVVVDSMERSSSYALARLEGLRVPIIKADVRFFTDYDGFDVVIHTAAYVSVEESVRDPLKYFENNVLGTARVGYECAKRGLKLIYLSSAAVYGDPVKLPISEEHPTRPRSPYGLSKLQGEEILRNFTVVYGLKHVILRLFNVYGPGQNPSYAGVITSFLKRALDGEPLIIYGDGEQTRDFIYVDDVARVIEFLIEEDIFDNEVYNVGSGEPVTIKDLAKTIIKLVGKELPIIHVSPRPGDIKHSAAEVSKLRKFIKVLPTPLKDGLKKTLSELSLQVG